MAKIREITSGLRAPEGPVALKDGSVLVVELKGGALTRVAPDGKKEVVAEVGGAPNGAATGPMARFISAITADLFLPKSAGIRSPFLVSHRATEAAVSSASIWPAVKSRPSTRRATGTRYGDPMTWSSTQPAGCGSPISARSRKDGATAAEFTMRGPTARQSRRWSIP